MLKILLIAAVGASLCLPALAESDRSADSNSNNSIGKGGTACLPSAVNAQRPAVEARPHISALGIPARKTRKKGKQRQSQIRHDVGNSTDSYSFTDKSMSMHIVPPLPAVRSNDKQNPFSGFDLGKKGIILSVPR